MSTLHAEAQTWLSQDWERVERDLGVKTASLYGSRVLLTGAAGFLGFNFLHFLSYLNKRRSEKRSAIQVVAVDNYLRGKSRWIMELAQDDPDILLRTHDITKPWPADDTRYDFIIHGASVASPTFYRQYPLETLDANVAGLRNMLDLARLASVKSMVFLVPVKSTEIRLPTKFPRRRPIVGTLLARDRGPAMTNLSGWEKPSVISMPKSIRCP